MTSEDRHEERVRVAVVAALERIEGPDRGRLARIERELLARRARRRRGSLWWWAIAGLGLAAGAAGAYWGMYVPGEESGDRDTAPAVPGEEQGGGAREPAAGGDGEDAGNGEKPREDDGPVIYIGQ